MSCTFRVEHLVAFVLRSRLRSSAFSLLLPARGGRQRLHVTHQRPQALFRNLPLERRHDWLEARDDLGLRVQYRLADVILVRHDGTAVVQLYRLAENTYEVRS